MDIGRLATSIAVIGLAACGATACSDGAQPPPLGDYDGGGLPVGDVSAPPPCTSPAETCPCDDAGAQYYCGIIYRVSGTHVDCSKGYLTCQSDGTWSACQGPSIYQADQ
jgi:hypothetical protein